MRLACSIFLVQPFILTSAFVSTNQIPRHTIATTCLWDAPEPLAEEGSWQAFLDDETTGLIYYFDTKSGESLWEPPTSTFPEVRLPRKKQRQAEELRKQYRKARQQEAGGEVQVIEEKATAEEGGSGLPSWIEGLVEVKDKVVDTPAQEEIIVDEGAVEVVEEKGNWFTGLFGDKNAATVEEEEPVVEEVEEPTNGEKKGGFFAALGALKDKSAAVADKVEEAVTEPPPKKEEPKIIDTSPKPIKIEIGSHILPHPAKVRWGGEDALFVKGRTFGVFDGVSGAEKLDGVPLYSRTLANEMKKALGKDGVSVQDLTKMLTAAADFADDVATGASTAVVASIGENGFLQALNVGDSLCLVIRDGKIAAKTREISHYWECPYQLSDDSPDRPKDGTKLNVELIPGDLIIMGSDGIFDNVDDDMLLDLVNKNNRMNPNQLSRKICDLSRKQSLDAKSVTPYARQAQRRGDPAFKSGLGGKVDDVSCIIVKCK